MTLQRSQGATRAQASPPDELPSPVPSRSAAGSCDRSGNGRFAPNNAAGKKPRLSLCKVARPEDAGVHIDPTYKRFLRAAGAYRKARSKELAAMAGGSIGIGVSGLVASASYALADARYLRALASQCIDPKDRADMLVKAGRLEANSKTAEIAAYELAVREAAARKAAPMDAAAMALLVAEASRPA